MLSFTLTTETRCHTFVSHINVTLVFPQPLCHTYCRAFSMCDFKVCNKTYVTNRRVVAFQNRRLD